jgi:hypothetical protein
MCMSANSVTARVAALGVSLGFLTACTSGGGHQAQPPSETESAAPAASGTIAGVVDRCAGPSVTPLVRTTVSVLHTGSLVASAHVIAGKPGRDRYRIAVPTGTYVVEASDWPKVRRYVVVKPNAVSDANFPNVCD